MNPVSASKHVSFSTAVLLLLLAAPGAHAKTTARYEAVLSDGARVDGDKVSGWHEHPGSPRLDNTVLFDAKRPLRWLRDNSLKPYRQGDRCPGYIEFVGGDRLVGRVAGIRPGGEVDGPYIPAHLLVKPAAPLHQPGRGSPQYVRVLPGRIGRVVFQGVSPRQLRPGTLFCFDGRRLGFLALRWQKDSVVLLLKDGTYKVKMSEIAEAHLPQIDPWQAYYEELAILSPECRRRLMRLETISGLIATGSDLRFDATWLQKQETLERIERIDGQIARMKTALKQQRGKCDRARADCAKQAR